MSPTQSYSSATARAILPVHSSIRLINRESLDHSTQQAFTNKQSRPTYPLGIWSMIVSHLIEAVLITTLGLLLRWENKKRDKIQSQMPGGLEGRDLDATAFLDLTDRENLK